MSTRESTITQKGQVTIPIEIREQLGLKPKDRVRFDIEDGVVVMKPVESKILTYYGSVPMKLPDDDRALREEIERAFADEVVDRLRREE